MSNHPSYYAAGRPLLTQERLARKHEREHARQRDLDQIDKYFSGWNAQSKTLDHWKQLQHQHNQSKDHKAHHMVPPYDCDVTSSPKPILPAKLQKVSQDLRNTVRALNELERDAVEIKETSLRIISLLTEIRNKRRDVYQILRDMDSKHVKISFVRSARDRLLHQLFLVLHKIHVIDSAVKHCNLLIDSPVFCPEEKQDLCSVLISTGNILRVMTSLNNTRNSDIASMYSEEADHSYEVIMMQWTEEDEMIRQVMEKVFETIDSALMDKLEANAELEEELLLNRKSQVEQLVSFTSSLKIDQSFWKLLDGNFITSLEALNHK